ncbi:phosphodiester glycosidase family protein [Streptomyces sp. TBY4]|uniref:phosphodiester glycosidase family protein n=1 Tax=Streptomyces sp. TBY4 TaxID=2962030 RepID=UPI0020B7ED84|nr:phosphodiester glycosidase family protein [Streptomyces sp. TBY4]MCP3758123.1 phosphodiester glycosidase family protein [Streptomyces sp. TBY4]
MPRIRGGLAAAVVLTSLAFLTPGGSAVAEDVTLPAMRMPLGPAELEATPGAIQTLAPGVTYQKYRQGQASDVWSVEVEIPYKSDPPVEPPLKSWAVGNKTFANDLVVALAENNFVGRVDSRQTKVLKKLHDDYPVGEVLYEHKVRVGRFAPSDQAGANQLKGLVESAGFSARIAYTGQDGADTTGPWEVRVVKVDPTANVAFQAVHGKDVRAGETVRDMAAAAGALVAVNASEFEIKKPVPEGEEDPQPLVFDGDPEGLHVNDGHLVSEPNNGRTALLLEGPGARVRVDEVSSKTQVTAADGQIRQIDGINRVPGRNRGCGGIGTERREDGKGKNPETEAWRGALCVDPNEVVVFRPEWGATTPVTPGAVDVVVNSGWKVVAIRPPGGAIPATGRVMQGIGEGADWLRAHARPDDVFKPGTTITDSGGKSLSGSTFDAVAGGGPALVRGGNILINTVQNGMHNPTYGTPTGNIVERHPRTLAGVTAAGELLLVTIDGRDPGISIGVTVPEAAEVMKWLGAKDAVSLGSGGDTTLIAKSVLYNRPMDSWTASGPTERRVSNAVVVVPK